MTGTGLALDVIPGRYSVDQDDFDPFFGALLVITLDGVEQRDVIEYDVEAGQLTRVRRDEAGLYLVDGDEIALEEVAGDVVVTMKPLGCPCNCGNVPGRARRKAVS